MSLHSLICVAPQLPNLAAWVAPPEEPANGWGKPQMKTAGSAQQTDDQVRALSPRRDLDA